MKADVPKYVAAIEYIKTKGWTLLETTQTLQTWKNKRDNRIIEIEYDKNTHNSTVLCKKPDGIDDFDPAGINIEDLTNFYSMAIYMQVNNRSKESQRINSIKNRLDALGWHKESSSEDGETWRNDERTCVVYIYYYKNLDKKPSFETCNGLVLKEFESYLAEDHSNDSEATNAAKLLSIGNSIKDLGTGFLTAEEYELFSDLCDFIKIPTDDDNRLKGLVYENCNSSSSR